MSETAAETVLGLDNIPLEFPLAGVGSRVLAAFVDFLLQFVVQIVWVFVSSLFVQGSGDGRAVARGHLPAGAFRWTGLFRRHRGPIKGKTLGKKGWACAW